MRGGRGMRGMRGKRIMGGRRVTRAGGDHQKGGKETASERLDRELNSYWEKGGFKQHGKTYIKLLIVSLLCSA
jgi:hypothetical protein